MKRKIFDLSGWMRVDRFSQVVTQRPGHVILDYQAHEVNTPLDVPSFGQTYRVLDSGYRWVRIHPHSGEGVMGHALTIQLDAAGMPVQLYIDIHGGEGLSEHGFPWHDDLYLDVLALLDPVSWQVLRVELIDQEELQAAHDAGLVTAGQVQASYSEAEKVCADLLAGTFAPLLLAREYLGLDTGTQAPPLAQT